jgi:hypothetical protein
MAAASSRESTDSLRELHGRSPIRLFRLTTPFTVDYVMISRRTFIVAGVAGSAALAGAYWLRASFQAGSAVDSDANAIVAAVVPVLLDGALPSDAARRSQAIDETVSAVRQAIAGLPPAAQRELGELFALLGFAPARVALARVSSPWARATAVEVEAFLERWRTSGVRLFRSAYDALHQLVLAAWYGQSSSWQAIGYPGPPELSS